MAISLTNVLKAFLTGVVYYSTSRLSKKTSIILGIVALVFISWIWINKWSFWSINAKYEH